MNKRVFFLWYYHKKVNGYMRMIPDHYGQCVVCYMYAVRNVRACVVWMDGQFFFLLFFQINQKSVAKVRKMCEGASSVKF